MSFLSSRLSKHIRNRCIVCASVILFEPAAVACPKVNRLKTTRESVKCGVQAQAHRVHTLSDMGRSEFASEAPSFYYDISQLLLL